jgi:putative ABC transport system permease protein
MTKHRDEDSLPFSKVPPVAEDVRREVEFHLEERVAELIAGGMSRDEALRVAREAFGDRRAVEDECREIEARRRHTRRRMRAREALRQDILVGFRGLRRSPGFALAAVATLALGVGANTAVFSIVNTVILRPLPYVEPERLIHVAERHEKGWANLAWMSFLDVQSQQRSFTAVTAYTAGTATVLGARTPQQVHGAIISRDFFRVFPVRPVLGRVPAPDEHRPGASPVAVVSHAFWRDQLGAPMSLEGVHLMIDTEMPVVGVLPRGFDFPDGAQVWMPVERTETRTSRTAHNYDVVGRLKPGMSAEDARRDLDALFDRMRPIAMPNYDATGSIVSPLQDLLTRNVRTPLYLLLGASALLLLAACTNLASSLLARGTARAGELAVRTALGATQSRLVRQLLTESALLAFVGCAAGVALASIALRALVLGAPATLPIGEVGMDAWVLAFAAATTILTTFLFGALPAMRLSRANAPAVLRDGARGTQDRGKLRVWNMLVAAEVAFAVALLAGSVLLIRSFGKVLNLELGFDPSQVHAAEVNLPAINYDGASPAISAFHDRILERLSATPGVEAAGFTSILPVIGGEGPDGMLEVAGRPLDPTGRHNGHALYRVVGGDYFRALGIRVIAGRTFEPRDHASAPPVAIVSEDFARHFWPDDDPIGKQLRPVGMDRENEPFATVIGVVASTRSRGVTGAFQLTYYFDHRQRPPFRSYTTSYVVRATSGAGAMPAVIRRTVHSVDPQVPVDVRSFDELLSASVADRRFTMVVLGVFAATALLLAIVGIYAVVSYSVTQRTREIGVRLALGATPGGVRALVVGTAMRAVVPGLAVGLVIAIADARLLRALVFGVSPFDPAAIGIALGTLLMAALFSSAWPAWRATQVNPSTAIRSD